MQRDGERAGLEAPFRSGAQIALRLPQAGPRGPLEPFQGIITSGGVNPSDTDKYFTLDNKHGPTNRASRASTILNLGIVLDADFPDVIRWRGEIHVTYTRRSCVGKVTLRSPPQLRGTRDHRAWQNDHLDHGRTATGRTF
jgi:hypothetical protein